MMTAVPAEDKFHSHMQDRLPETTALAFLMQTHLGGHDLKAHKYDLLKEGAGEN